MKVHNPIIRGFYPDPSICKANETYYLACSSFQYYPGVPVWESKDLVNWKMVTHCLTKESQMGLHEVPSSGGVFAPTLRYHNGRFYMVTNQNTLQKNFYVWTDDLTKEWSEPIYVDQEGIDPSLLFDGDKVYFTSNGNGPDGKPCILQCEIDIETGKKLTDSIPVWGGSGGRYLESPHLYHFGDYYYLMAAEGGTEYGHMITYARSKEPFGPFESYAKNPVLTNRNLGGNQSRIQGIGHGDLIEDENGNFYLVCLGFRQIGIWQAYHHLGREVFLTQVHWNDDGWFTAGEDGTVREYEETKLSDCVQKDDAYDVSFEKLLSNESQQMRLCYLRDPKMGNYRFEKDTHSLCLRGTSVTLEDVASPTFLGVRQSEFDTELTAKVKLEEVPEGTDGKDVGYVEAGITIYMDECEHYDLYIASQRDIFEEKASQEGTYRGKAYHGTTYCVNFRVRTGDAQCIVKSMPVDNPDKITLKLTSDAEQYYAGFENENGEYIPLGKARTKYLSSEVAGGFTGVVAAMYAVDQTPAGRWTRFTQFDWKQKSTKL